MLFGARLVSTLSRSRGLVSSATRWKQQGQWVRRAVVGGSCLIASAGGITYAKSSIPQGSEEFVAMDEVAKHNTPDDAWIVIDGKVYDVSSWIPWHPGGSKILEAHAGKDVSRQFHSLKHSQTAMTLMSGLHIADVSNYSPPAIQEYNQEPSRGGKPRVVIVGAGICGVAAAYFLSQEDRFEITVVDRSHLVGGTALASSAILFLGGLVEKEDLSKADLMKWSGQWQFEFMKTMQREWEDIDMVERGTMGVIQTPEQLAYLQKHLAPGGRMHGKMELLSREEMLRLEPHLSPSLLGATLVPQGATFDPFLVCNAFAKRAKHAGARFLHGRHVAGISKAEGGATAGAGSESAWVVQCRREDGGEERLTADMVLVCNGWQTNQVLTGLGVEVPVRGVQGQMFATQHPSVRLAHNLFSWEGPHFWATNPQIGHQDTVDRADGHRITRHLYGLQISNGTLKFGGDRRTCHGDEGEGVDEDGIAETVRQVAEVIPALDGCDVVGSWSGVMPFVKDQKPLIGQVQPGLWVLTGAPFTKGASYAKLLSEFVCGDPAHAHLKAEVSPLRFNRPAPQLAAPAPPPPALSSSSGSSIAASAPPGLRDPQAQTASATAQPQTAASC